MAVEDFMDKLCGRRKVPLAAFPYDRADAMAGVWEVPNDKEDGAAKEKLAYLLKSETWGLLGSASAGACARQPHEDLHLPNFLCCDT
eukprot:CAMPEP_0169197540 /NCGR_PEP_ID=MMETSP1016-20121227/8328_1 /TAXON_ID=342587 /ORGANISM="Karlodinium micrum, Strain CCMP2283" /LENGTH=86 /DNA_ID=CAMNT_0009274205 /DNA_START=184 /DNA_END=445 /DNA_ORIENTATION=-